MDPETRWRHQMETFPRYWPFVRGIHRSLVNSPHKGQWRGALMFSLIYARIKGWVNNREAGDLWRHCAHYDVNVTEVSDIMQMGQFTYSLQVKCRYVHTSLLTVCRWMPRWQQVNVSSGSLYITDKTLQWRHDGRDGVSNHLAQDRLLIHLFRRRSKETSKLRVTSLCEGNSPVTRVVKRVSIDEWHENIYELVKKLRKIYAAFT